MNSSTLSEKNRTEIAVAVVRRRGEVLAGPRLPGQPLAGCWEFPGGKIEPGESPAEAAIRECREETGMAVRIAGLLAVVDHTYLHGRLRLHFFDAAPVESESLPRPPFRWLNVAEIQASDFPPANATVIEHLKAEI